MVRRGLLVLCVLIALPDGAQAALPLGPASLTERRTATAVAPGVRLVRIVRSGRGDGPWRVFVLEISRSRSLRAVLSNDRIPGLERTSSMARRTRAVAGVNGGHFVTAPSARGDPVGVLAVDGQLVSETVGIRTALLVPRATRGPPRVAALRFGGRLVLDGRSRLVDGIDRVRGRIPGCGGFGGDRPTQRPNPFLTCTDPSELVVLDRRWGERTGTTRAGVEVVVRRGVVTAVRREPDTAIPSDGYVLSGSGDAATFLRGARPGDRPELDLGLRDGRRTVSAADYESITGSGPRLLRAGRVDITDRSEAQQSLAGRNPRTLVGVRGDGTVILAAIDGRRPGWSVGTTFRESAAVMRSLGARDALAFDGGGSTTMAVGRRVVNRPSDGSERPVGDGLFVLP
jgi:Phosphodiester glycosidase